MTQLDQIDDRWRIGELAEATGTSVRALHHYDRLGLLPPRDRSPSGYRLYGREEVERLYVIVALRELGMSLADIGSYLDEAAPEDPRSTLAVVAERHLASVRRDLQRQREIERRLEDLLGSLASSADPSIADVRTILEGISMHNKYYTPEQLAELKERRDELGDEGMARAQQDWQDLIREVAGEKDKGTDPSDPRMQALADRWQGLIEAFTGGDPGIRASLQKMHDDEGSEAASRGMVDPEVMTYMQAALQARGR